ncbi:putative mRNA cleavage and polyadenylation factor CLP1 P loop [Trypanosoma vivax]|uniref:Putative conserved pre-mRNA cleavage complex II Clp1-like n=1 Tax=Trypanosoma vivax (strain Y486) TaxID=1055687 RepID=G0TX37_TRYVY|nr:hypothetical protein TRVL_02704 [Trypanosoma vivax]KAH8614018.1 putative mRNA cleavage and polyadenylation factor CLP1 P loop [Trypanosoma vivax]CCC48527.1 putative conserved pre-mRNA cleavage complex II Clp1-like [Trypanosoma vivax Y486]
MSKPADAAHNISHKNFELERSELSLHFIGPGAVVLVDGVASAHGAPLKKNVRYNFAHCGVPVVCPLSCRLHVEGNFTYAVGLINSHVDDIHAVIDLARAEATIGTANSENKPRSSERCVRGPNVLVIGDNNTGKSSICRALANLATSSQTYGVALVDADVGQQGITCPGSIATVFVEQYIPVDDGFNTMMPLTFFLGDKTVTPSTRRRYLDFCALTAQAVGSVRASKPKFALGGMIVNTMGWVTGLGRDILLDLLSVFDVTHVVVCGSDEELADEVRRAMIGRTVAILSYPKQPRMFPRDTSQRRLSRTEQLCKYFLGTIRTPLSSFRGVAFIKDVHFIDAVTLERLTWCDVKPLSLAAVSWADSLEMVSEANIAGFIVMLEVGKKFFSFLSPAAGSLPKPFLLVSPVIKLPWEKVPPISAP